MLFELFSFVPNYLYSAVYQITIFTLCIFMVLRLSASNKSLMLEAKTDVPMAAGLLAIIVILFMGTRPTYGIEFGDTDGYRRVYENFNASKSGIDTSSEWLWANLIYFFKLAGFPFSYYILFVATMYIGLMLLSCNKLFPNNTWIALLICLASFSTYSFGINGIRNGMACSMVLYGIALIVTGVKKEQISGLIILFLALGVHRSTALPMVALGAAWLYIKEPKLAIRFWIASIFISLIAGNAIGSIFAGLGFDDRMNEYFTSQDNTKSMSQFTQTGFRFDFLLYSAMPVLMTWYCTVKRNFKDRTFNLIANTYILSNSFWVMVIRAAFSNRFAYLSWFIYPIVIIYPLLRFRMWEDQDQKTALIIFFYASFTFGMFLLGKI